MMPVLLVDKYRTISAANSAVRVRKCYGKSVCIVQEVLAGNGPGLAQLRMICNSFQPGNKVIKKALVSINHQNRNCSQADVSGQALCNLRLLYFLETILGAANLISGLSFWSGPAGCFELTGYLKP